MFLFIWTVERCQEQNIIYDHDRKIELGSEDHIKMN